MDPNFPDPHGPHDARIIIYAYIPSFALCILGTILFALSFAIHAIQIARYHTYSFSTLSIGCVLEVIGYIFRALSSRKDPYNIIYFVMEYFCIVTAPVFISASVYVCLSKLITWASRDQAGTKEREESWLRPTWILWGFVTCDVFSTIVQITGAAMIGTATSHHKSAVTPNNILLAGLAIQTFAFTVFLVLLGVFRATVAQDMEIHSQVQSKDPFILALGSASLLVYLRTIFRLAETSQGVFGYLSSHEVFFGVLEFTPVVIAVWILAVWHPGRWLPGRRDVAMVEHPGTVSLDVEVKTV